MEAKFVKEIPTVEKPSGAPAGKQSPLAKLPQPEHGHIRHAVAVMSGKGGVGKSSIAALLAFPGRAGKRVGLLDADITGPSIPKLFGLHQHAAVSDEKLIRRKAPSGSR